MVSKRSGLSKSAINNQQNDYPLSPDRVQAAFSASVGAGVFRGFAIPVPARCPVRGMTPLYDAIGLSLTRLEHHTASLADVAVVVTIITDGLENASREYRRESIHRLIDEMKGKGWAFNFMGANQDSYASARDIGIHHSRNFDYSEKGTQSAFGFTRRWTENFTQRLNRFKHQEEAESRAYTEEMRQKSYSDMASSAYDEATTYEAPTPDK